MMGGWGWMSPFHFLVPILFLVLVVAGVFLVVRALSGPSGGTAAERRSTALDVLAERYARGEIDRDEYLKRKADLSA